MLERRSRGGTARACALHIEVDDTLFVTAENDIPSVAGDSRAYPSLDQILDGGDSLCVLRIEEFIGICCRLGGGRQERLTRHVVLHDSAEDCRLHLLPIAAGLGY